MPRSIGRPAQLSERGPLNGKAAPTSRRERPVEAVIDPGGADDPESPYATAFWTASAGSGTSEIVFRTCEAIW